MSAQALGVLKQTVSTNIVSAKNSDNFSASVELDEEPLVEVLYSVSQSITLIPRSVVACRMRRHGISIVETGL